MSFEIRDHLRDLSHGVLLALVAGLLIIPFQGWYERVIERSLFDADIFVEIVREPEYWGDASLTRLTATVRGQRDLSNLQFIPRGTGTVKIIFVRHEGKSFAIYDAKMGMPAWKGSLKSGDSIEFAVAIAGISEITGDSVQGGVSDNVEKLFPAKALIKDELENDREADVPVRLLEITEYSNLKRALAIFIFLSGLFWGFRAISSLRQARDTAKA